MARNRLPYDIPEGNVITMRNVCMNYTKNTAALNGVSLNIKQGEFVFIVGDSGSGKSTLIKLLLRELEPTSGYINVLGYDLGTLKRRKIPKFRRNLGIVFQDFRLLKDRNIYENVAFAQRIIQASSASIRRNVPATLARVGLANKYKNKPSEISGGEQQRVALARALVNRPLMLLADEPTGNLDPRNSWEIMKLLEEINEKEGMTVVVVTHNREIVNAMHKRVITVRRGMIIEDEREGSYTSDENVSYTDENYDRTGVSTGVEQYTQEFTQDITQDMPREFTEDLQAIGDEEIYHSRVSERSYREPADDFRAQERPYREPERDLRAQERPYREPERDLRAQERSYRDRVDDRYAYREEEGHTEEFATGELTEELIDLDGKL